MGLPWEVADDRAHKYLSPSRKFNGKATELLAEASESHLYWGLSHIRISTVSIEIAGQLKLEINFLGGKKMD